jgi:hypothetical protein
LFNLQSNNRSIFPQLATFNQKELIRTLANKLIELSESMEQQVGRNFLTYVLDIAANDNELKQQIENAILRRAGKKLEKEGEGGITTIIIIVIVIIIICIISNYNPRGY